MFLQINDQMRIADLQERFSDCYPGLVIEFYRSPKTQAGAANIQAPVTGEETVGEIRDDGPNGALELKSWYTVAKAEKMLRESYGLYAKIRCEAYKGYHPGVPHSNLTLLALSLAQPKEIDQGEEAAADHRTNEVQPPDETVELENRLFLTR